MQLKLLHIVTHMGPFQGPAPHFAFITLFLWSPQYHTFPAPALCIRLCQEDVLLSGDSNVALGVCVIP